MKKSVKCFIVIFHALFLKNFQSNQYICDEIMDELFAIVDVL